MIGIYSEVYFLEFKIIGFEGIDEWLRAVAKLGETKFLKISHLFSHHFGQLLTESSWPIDF